MTSGITYIAVQICLNLVLGIDPQVIAQVITIHEATCKENEVELLLGFLCNPTRTLPYNSTRTLTL
jgi:hypothetical protein